MPNFDVEIRTGYEDLTGLVLDLRSQDLVVSEGTHDGSNNAATLSDSTANWAINEHVGKVVQNVTDGSYGVVTANTATTVTASLVGGTDTDWDTGDAYSIQGDNDGVLSWPNAAPAARPTQSEYAGAHDGANNSATLDDSTAPWAGMDLVGLAVENVTDGSTGWITANTDSQVTATLAGGTDDDWDTGDVYSIYDPRFGNPQQATAANQPVVKTVSGYRVMDFTRARSHYLKIPLDDPFPDTWWTVAVEFWKGSSSANSQHILDVNTLEIFRRNGAGVEDVQHGSVDITGAGDHPDGLCMVHSLPTNDVDYYHEGVIEINGAPPTAAAVDVPAGAAAGYIGTDSTTTNYLEGWIRSLRIWDRPMSPLEIDFAFKYLDTDGDDHSVQDRATMALRIWTDETGDYSRINQRQTVPQRFVVAVVDGTARVQIAASVAGKVRPDSELGSKLFDMSVVEAPGALPMVNQDASWSSVFDVTFDEDEEGHYAFLVYREDGGGVIIHIDVEAAP